MRINGISNPNLINVGQQIKLKGDSAPVAPQYRTYKVVRGDTLSGIALKMLGAARRYPEIKSLNGLKSDTIYSGQDLKIPN